MPKVIELDGVRISINSQDHVPPHVHAEYSGHEALIIIATGAVLEGSLPSNKLAVAREYVRANAVALQAKWDQLNPPMRK